MGIVGLIVSIGLILLFARIEYNIFESSGFKGVVVYKIVLETILLVASMLLNSVPINLITLSLLIPTFIGVIISILISTAIEYYAYNKTNSFLMFLVYNFLIVIFIVLGLTAILFVVMCFIEPSLLSNKIVKLILLIVLILLIIIIICCIIKFIRNRKIEKIVDNQTQNTLKVIHKEENNEIEEEIIAFCPGCGFKLARNSKFCMRCGKHFNNN